MYSSLLILQTRCFFFQWKVLTGEIFKVVLKANKLFFLRMFWCGYVLIFFFFLLYIKYASNKDKYPFSVFSSHCSFKTVMAKKYSIIIGMYCTV